MPNNYISHLKIWYIENSRVELRGMVLPLPSNQIKVIFIIILPFYLIHLWFFPVSHRNWRKRWVDYWGEGKGYVGPPLKLFGDLPPCPPPPPPPPCPYTTNILKFAAFPYWNLFLSMPVLFFSFTCCVRAILVGGSWISTCLEKNIVDSRYLTSIISSNRLSRRENLIPVLK